MLDRKGTAQGLNENGLVFILETATHLLGLYAMLSILQDYNRETTFRLQTLYVEYGRISQQLNIVGPGSRS